MAGTRLTKEIISQVKALKEKDLTNYAIAKELGIGATSVSDIMHGNVVAYEDRQPKIVVEKPKKVEEFNPSNPFVRNDSINWIRKHRKGFTVEQLAKRLKCDEKGAVDVIRHLSQHDGYNLLRRGSAWELCNELAPLEKLDLGKVLGEKWKFGIVSDTHLGSVCERLDVLEAAYDCFAKEGITTVFHAGNIIDGEFRFNKYELQPNCVGVHNQALYVADKYPQRKGITTHFITGDCHEGWYQGREGMNIGWYIQHVCEDNGRNDMIHIGHIERDVVVERPYGKCRIRIMHPGGGCAYALSYPSQKMVESFQGGDKPHMLIMGHYHKFDQTYPREVWSILAGCMQDQTSFMRKKRLGAHVGYIIAELGIRIDGTAGSTGVTFHPFYDRAYHRKLEEYEV
jgi:predicted phosphodiesterase